MPVLAGCLVVNFVLNIVTFVDLPLSFLFYLGRICLFFLNVDSNRSFVERIFQKVEDVELRKIALKILKL